jgi:hypothetical protein
MEQALSFVNLQTEIRFLMSCGACRTLERMKRALDDLMEVVPVPRIGRVFPLPTMM